MPKDISLEIEKILNTNRVDDLKAFLKKRQCLNSLNLYLIYLFYLVQSAGILTTSFAAGNNNQNLVWVGISLNIIASLISIYEKTNSSILKKLLNDIKSIIDGNYIDESELVDTDNINVQSVRQPPVQLQNQSNITNTTDDANTQLKTPLLENNIKDPSTMV